MAVCAAGGREIVGPTWLVDDWRGIAQAPMCEIHARIVGLGRALHDLLGPEHPWLVESTPYFADKANARCPDLQPDSDPLALDDEARRLLDSLGPR